MRPIEVLERYLAAMRSGDREIELIDVLGGEEHVALMVREALRGEHGVLDILRTDVYRVVDDLMVEIRASESDRYAVDACFGGAA